MKKLTLETTQPFQGLPELVAYEEGLFEKEGLQIEWADRHQGVTERVATNIITPKGLDPFLTHGKMLEDGKADMYNACEWGNYCRVEETGKQSRQVGRRAIIAYAAIVVGPKSAIYTPQQLANVAVGVPFYFGTHYVALHLLQGFMPRDMVKLCSAPSRSYFRLKRINANKSAYMHYFIDYHVKKGETEVAQLKVSDLREGRLVVTDPAPIPAEELERTAEWLKSWDMLGKTDVPGKLVDDDVQRHAHIAAE
jgi:hypothetical protein